MFASCEQRLGNLATQDWQDFHWLQLTVLTWAWGLMHGKEKDVLSFCNLRQITVVQETTSLCVDFLNPECLIFNVNNRLNESLHFETYTYYMCIGTLEYISVSVFHLLHELTRFSPWIDQIFSTAIFKWYLKGQDLGLRAENLGLGFKI